MAGKAETGKRYLSHTLAEWACGLRFEQLSDKAVHTAKLFWYDSLGCALGGSQQEDAKILLEHHREMSGATEPAPLSTTHSPLSTGSRSGSGPCTTFVSGFKTNPVDAAFMNSHMVR